MVSTIKVETFDVDVTATSSQTHTLTNTVVMNNSFVRRTTSIDKQSGPTGSTGNANANIACGAAYLSSTTQISFRQNSTTSQKIVGEVWRYTGSGGGVDEFIVRGRHTVTLSSGSATGSTSVSGISSRDKCIPFWTGATQTANSVNDYDSSTVSVYIDGSDNIQVERGATTGTLVVYVTIVEFTGSNWSVGHVKSTSHDSSDQLNITMRTNNLATTGTFDVGNWETATLIEGSLEGDTSETGLSDNLACWEPGSSTSTASFLLHIDSNARNDGVAYCHILKHPGLVSKRGSSDNFSEGNGTYTNASWPAESSTSESLDELSLEWYSDSSGTGTAHARGRLSARITDASGTIQTWVHRSGNNIRIRYGVINLSGIDGSTYIVITDVDTDEIINNSQTNVVITSTAGGFESTQGTGKVELVENSDYTGTKITQVSIDSWSDTSIQFDTNSGALSDSYCYLFVTNNSGGQGLIAIQVGNPPETYQEAIEGMSTPPSHYWTFQNTYDDAIGFAIANVSSGGTPGFSSTRKLAKDDTHSLQLDGTDYISPADQSDMNVTVTATRRYMGGWIQLDSISQILSVLYEEGAQVNNIAFLNGFGNNLMMQVADTGDDYVQAYSDVSLTTNRPYHIMIKFEASAQDAEVRMYLDGILQTRSNGNPWSATNLDTHSGNISWGHEGIEQLQVGDSTGSDNVDITFASPNACNYSNWVNWTNFDLNPDDIREILFEKGALAEKTIDGDIESVMQTDIDALSDTLYTDWPCSIEVGICIGGDFELTLDNITFEDRVSMQVRYMGVDTLTLVMENGTILDTDKLGTPYGGAIVIVNAPPVTVTVKDISDNSAISGARVLLSAATGGDLPFNDSISITSVNNTATVTHTTHGLITGNKVKISGATQLEYNGIHTITVTTANTYTYTISGVPITPATGSPICTSVLISDITNTSGSISINHRYTSEQPISGYVRAGSGATKYIQGNISGSITSSGYDGTVLMVIDE